VNKRETDLWGTKEKGERKRETGDGSPETGNFNFQITSGDNKVTPKTIKIKYPTVNP